MNSESKAWYKYPWVYLVIALPLSSVIAGIATIIITNKHQPEMVVDDYYKKGKAINQELTLYKAFDETKLNLALLQTGNRIEISVDNSEAVKPSNKALPLSALKVSIVHSTQGKRDLSFVMTPNGQGVFSKTLDTALSGKWNLFIEPMDGSWKIKQKVVFPASTWLKLENR